LIDAITQKKRERDEKTRKICVKTNAKCSCGFPRFDARRDTPAALVILGLLVLGGSLFFPPTIRRTHSISPLKEKNEKKSGWLTYCWPTGPVVRELRRSRC